MILCMNRGFISFSQGPLSYPIIWLRTIYICRKRMPEFCNLIFKMQSAIGRNSPVPLSPNFATVDFFFRGRYESMASIPLKRVSVWSAYL